MTSVDDWFSQQLAQSQAGVPGGGGGATAAPTSSDDPLLAPVYMGPVRPSAGPDRFQGKPIPGAEGGLKTGSLNNVTTTVGDAYDEFHRMSDAERAAFARKLESLGVLEPGSYGYGELASLWREAVDEAADIYRASGRRVSPTGYLDLMKQTGMGAQGEAFDGRDVTKNTETVNNKSVSLTNRVDARAAIRTAFQSELGRDPTRKETRAFFKALRSAERANPTTTTGTRSSRTVTTRQENGNSKNKSSSSDNTTTEQSFDAGNYLDNYVDDRYDKELDARRSATDYYGALLDLAGGGS